MRKEEKGKEKWIRNGEWVNKLKIEKENCSMKKYENRRGGRINEIKENWSKIQKRKIWSDEKEEWGQKEEKNYWWKLKKYI